MRFDQILQSGAMFVAVSILGSYAIGQESSNTDWQRGFLNQYCVACHNDVTRTANFTLQTIALDKVGHETAEVGVWEKVLLKLRAR